LAGLAAAIVVAPASAQADTCVGADDPLTDSPEQERTLLCLTNIHRANNGLGPLAMDPILQQTARQYSGHMRSETLTYGNSFNHFGGWNHLEGNACEDDDAAAHDPGCDYPWDRAQANGFPSDQVAENIARVSISSPKEVFEGFHNSPGHNAIMLGPNWVVAGIGISGNSYVTENFSSTNTGATDTAVDLLITDECIVARNEVTPLEQQAAAKKAALDAAKEKLKKAKKKSKKKKRKAKRAVKTAEQELKDAQNALAAAQATAQAACAATHY
jgi:uncharacterized protein YkwD